MAYIEVDIDIDDYLEDASTDALKREIKSRNEDLVESDNSKEKLQIIKELLGLRAWHSGQRVVTEIKELISFTTGENFENIAEC